MLIHIKGTKSDEQKEGVRADVTRAVATYFNKPEHVVRVPRCR